MIEKLKTINPYDETEIDMDVNSVAGLVYENTPLVQKINELVDAVNNLQKDYDNVCIWVGEQKLKTPAENAQDKFAEQRKWIGCLVRYKICDWQGGWATDVLEEIVEHPIYPFKMRNGQTAQVCELVTADEIYPNKARTW